MHTTPLRAALCPALVAAALVWAPPLTGSVLAGAPTHPSLSDNRPTTWCDGRRVTIVGTNGNDTLRGTPGPDVIAALGGHDTVFGFGGDDVVCGGRGIDELLGGPGDDRLFGQLDGYRYEDDLGDRLAGGDGDDYLAPGHHPKFDGRTYLSYAGASAGVTVDLQAGYARGAAGNDTIVGHFDTSFTGSDHDDRIFGSSRDDLIDPGEGRDLVVTRGGDDQVNSSALSSRTDRDPDLVQLGPGDDYYFAERGEDKIFGQGGSDQFHSYASMSGYRLKSPALSVYGGSGDDLFDLGLMPDGSRVTGGTGRDEWDGVSFYNGIADLTRLTVSVPRRQWELDVRANPVRHFEGRLAGIEEFRLANEGFIRSVDFVGSDADEWVDAREITAGIDGQGHLSARMGPGDDVALGTDGDDVIDGGTGDDRAVGGYGDNECRNVERPVNCD